MMSLFSSNTLSKSETEVSTLWITGICLNDDEGDGEAETPGVEVMTEGLSNDKRSNLCNE